VSDILRRKPITGMAGGYARDASGHRTAVSGLIELAPRMLRWTDLRMRPDRSWRRSERKGHKV